MIADPKNDQSCFVKSIYLYVLHVQCKSKVVKPYKINNKSNIILSLAQFLIVKHDFFVSSFCQLF